MTLPTSFTFNNGIKMPAVGLGCVLATADLTRRYTNISRIDAGWDSLVKQKLATRWSSKDSRFALSTHGLLVNNSTRLALCSLDIAT